MDKKSTFYSLWFLICVVCNEKLHTLFDYTGQNIWINPLISSFVENFYITTHDALHMFLLLQIFNLQKIRFKVNEFLLQKKYYLFLIFCTVDDCPVFDHSCIAAIEGPRLD